jgi:hypothetical protein
MMSSEKRKFESTREQLRGPDPSRTCSMGAKRWPFREQILDPVSSPEKEPLLKPQPASAQTSEGYPADTSFKYPAGQSQAPDSEMPSIRSRPADLEAGNVFAL